MIYNPSEARIAHSERSERMGCARSGRADKEIRAR